MKTSGTRVLAIAALTVVIGAPVAMAMASTGPARAPWDDGRGQTSTRRSDLPCGVDRDSQRSQDRYRGPMGHRLDPDGSGVERRGGFMGGHMFGGAGDADDS